MEFAGKLPTGMMHSKSALCGVGGAVSGDMLCVSGCHVFRNHVRQEPAK